MKGREDPEKRNSSLFSGEVKYPLKDSNNEWSFSLCRASPAFMAILKLEY